MEINITKFFLSDHGPLYYLAGSAAEHGPKVAEFTYGNSCALGTKLNLLDTPEKLQAFKDFVKSSGFDIRGDEDWQGLFVRVVSASMREMCCKTIEDLTHHDVLDAQEQGYAPSCIYLGSDGEVYFYAGE